MSESNANDFYEPASGTCNGVTENGRIFSSPRLRRTLANEGQLSPDIVNRTVGLPCKVMFMQNFSPTELADDILRGADEIAALIFGESGSRRKVY